MNTKRIKEWEAITGEDYNKFKGQVLRWKEYLEDAIIFLGDKEFYSLDDYFEHVFSLNIGYAKVKKIEKATTRFQKKSKSYFDYAQYKWGYTKKLNKLKKPTGWITSIFSSYEKEKAELERIIGDYETDMALIRKNRAYLWDEVIAEIEAIINEVPEEKPVDWESTLYKSL